MSSSSQGAKHLRLLTTAIGSGLRVGDANPVLAFEPPEPNWISCLGNRRVVVWEPNAAKCARLDQAGIPWTHIVPDACSAALVICTKFKVRNLWNIARAWSALAPGGELVCLAENSLGAPSLGKFLHSNFPTVETSAAAGAKVFRVPKIAADLPGALAEYLNLSNGLPVAGTNLITYPGVFSAKGPDIGSQLLLSTLPDDISGRGCDLGAGYGYLSHGILARSQYVSEIDLYEIDALAIEASRRNLMPAAGRAAIGFKWHDVTEPIDAPPYDWVVSNPPFHIGSDSAVSLGQEFIRRAASVLSKGGKLFLVANTTLPYGSVLGGMFSEWHLVANTQGYKVIHAVK